MFTRSTLSKLLVLFIAAALALSSLAFVTPALAQGTCGDSETVVKGDTLQKIATRCGTTVAALMRANPDIKNRSLIYPGQVIMLPGAIIRGTGSTDIYIIQRGDTLFKLANRFNTTVDRLLELNAAITNRNVIYEGQRLNIPSNRTPDPVAGQTYIVRRGDTLRSIASRFGTTVEVLLKLNPSITDANKISVGQSIVLPNTVTIYTVVRGDTLRLIASRYSTTVDALLKLNTSITDANKIYVGQVIRIK